MKATRADDLGAQNNGQGDAQSSAQDTRRGRDRGDPPPARRTADLERRYRRIGIPAVAAALACRGARAR
jgi:hypothetical protein